MHEEGRGGGGGLAWREARLGGDLRPRWCGPGGAGEACRRPYQAFEVSIVTGGLDGDL